MSLGAIVLACLPLVPVGRTGRLDILATELIWTIFALGIAYVAFGVGSNFDLDGIMLLPLALLAVPPFVVARRIRRFRLPGSPATHFDRLRQLGSTRSRYGGPRTMWLSRAAIVPSVLFVLSVLLLPIMVALAVVAIYLSFFSVFALMKLELGYLPWAAAAIGLLVIATGLSIWLWRTGEKYRRRDLAGPVPAQVEPVLLLRSFADDQLTVISNRLLDRLQRRRPRLEEVLVGTAQRIAPVLAVGAPGETLPPLGAYRRSFAADDWQRGVRQLIEQCRIALVIVGATRWVGWELSSVIEAGACEKLILINPPDEKGGLSRRWQTVTNAFAGTPWREALAGVQLDRSLAVCFGNDGSVINISSDRRTQCDYDLGVLIAVSELGATHPADIAE
jgi:hypothetical protein